MYLNILASPQNVNELKWQLVKNIHNFIAICNCKEL